MNMTIMTTVFSLIGFFDPTLVRVAVVDDSPSMRGNRIDTVRNELLSMFRQLPPSPQYPVQLIVFHGTVEKTKVLTDPKTAEAAVAALTGNGTGTHIAPALVRAREVIQPYHKTSTVLLMLFTDGEDTDPKGIQQAEEQLDRLFADRGKRGLSQTVFVKRWGGANANLINRIRQHGHAQLLDAGDLKVESVTVAPGVTLGECRRDPAAPGRAEVNFTPIVMVRPAPSKGSLPIFEFTCRNAGVADQARVQIDPNVPPRAFKLSVPISAEAERTGRLPLSFSVTIVPAAAAGASFLLPILESSAVEVVAQLPSLQLTNRLTVESKLAGPLEWDDPLLRRARCSVELTITVAASDFNAGVDRSMTLRVEPASGTRLVGDNKAIPISGPGRYRIPLMFHLSVPQPATGAPIWNGPLSFKLHATPKAPILKCDPPMLEIVHRDLKAPAPVKAILAARVNRVGTAVWINLAEPLIAFDAEVVFQVTGTIPQQTTLTLTSPGNVRNNVLPANTYLRSGDTVVPMHVVARVSPNKMERLDFSITPPPATDSLAFHTDKGFTLSVQTPPPVPIVNADRSGPRPVVHVSVWDNQDSADLSLFPVLAGIDARQLEQVPRIRAVVHGPGTLVAGVPAQAFSLQPLTLQLPPATGQSFFVDHEQTIDVELTPDVPTMAITPGRAQVVGVRFAPFKRLLMYLAWGILAFGVLTIVFLGFRRSQETPSVR